MYRQVEHLNEDVTSTSLYLKIEHVPEALARCIKTDCWELKPQSLRVRRSGVGPKHMHSGAAGPRTKHMLVLLVQELHFENHCFKYL